jgi:predicted ribosome quality control (RQC) complex YloA/Tae2 family protein
MLEYISEDDVVIRLGQSAKENDLLTNGSDPKHWWMHASGYPGSHVVVCYDGEELPRNIKRDAAVLAIHHSKTPCSKMSWVDMTRVGNVSSLKQSGLVTLNGEVNQLTIFMRKESDRLERLLKHKNKVYI